MSISKTRGLLYSIARLLGDFQAIFFQRRPAPEREKSNQPGEPQARLQEEPFESCSNSLRGSP